MYPLISDKDNLPQKERKCDFLIKIKYFIFITFLKCKIKYELNKFKIEWLN